MSYTVTHYFIVRPDDDTSDGRYCDEPEEGGDEIVYHRDGYCMSPIGDVYWCGWCGGMAGGGDA